MNVIVIYTPYPEAAMCVAPFLSAYSAKRGLSALRQIYPGMKVEGVIAGEMSKTIEEAMKETSQKPCACEPAENPLGTWMEQENAFNMTSTAQEVPVHAGGFMQEDEV